MWPGVLSRALFRMVRELEICTEVFGLCLEFAADLEDRHSPLADTAGGGHPGASPRETPGFFFPDSCASYFQGWEEGARGVGDTSGAAPASAASPNGKLGRVG